MDKIHTLLGEESYSTINHIQGLIELQVLNGNELQEKYLGEGPSNAQYTSRFIARVLLEAIEIWLKKKYVLSSRESQFFYLSR